MSGHVRPFWPEYYTEKLDEAGTLVKNTVWTNTGWPLDLKELKRKNRAHRAVDRANLYYVDTRENVYADVKADDQHSHGERPDLQLEAVIQDLTWMEAKDMLRMADDSNEDRDCAADGVLALGLHKSDAQAADVLGIMDDDFRRWFERATLTFFNERVKKTFGPSDPQRVDRPTQEKEFAELVAQFRARHNFPGEPSFRRLS